MQLPSTLRYYGERLVAPGSPLRFLRKAALYASKPRQLVRRLQLKNELLRDLPPHISETAEEMERTGYVRTDSLLDQSLLAELAAEMDRRMEGFRPGEDESDRKYWSRLTSAEDLHPSTVFVRFAMQRDVVKLATAYMGMVPYLSNVQVLVSFGTNNAKWEESQLWHRDYADTKTLRVWVYLNDVTESKSGPFTFLPREQSRSVPNTLLPGRVTDEQMEATGFSKDVRVVSGPRLTSFGIDTSRCYHMGSRVQLGQVRVAYVCTFNTHASLWPFYSGITLPTEPPLSELDRLLLSDGD